RAVAGGQLVARQQCLAAGRQGETGGFPARVFQAERAGGSARGDVEQLRLAGLAADYQFLVAHKSSPVTEGSVLPEHLATGDVADTIGDTLRARPHQAFVVWRKGEGVGKHFQLANRFAGGRVPQGDAARARGGQKFAVVAEGDAPNPEVVVMAEALA